MHLETISTHIQYVIIIFTGITIQGCVIDEVEFPYPFPNPEWIDTSEIVFENLSGDAEILRWELDMSFYLKRDTYAYSRATTDIRSEGIDWTLEVNLLNCNPCRTELYNPVEYFAAPTSHVALGDQFDVSYHVGSDGYPSEFTVSNEVYAAEDTGITPVRLYFPPRQRILEE